MPTSGAGGPCHHCGAGHSCCWRRGPPSKPILCNACGSRYLVKKNLDGYVPIQQRQSKSYSGGRKGLLRSASLNSDQMEPTMSTRRRKRSHQEGSDAVSQQQTKIKSANDDDSPHDPSIALSRRRSPRVHVQLATTDSPKDEDGDLIPSSSSDLVAHVDIEDVQNEKMHSRKLFLLGHGKQSLRLKPRKPLKPTISVVF